MRLEGTGVVCFTPPLSFSLVFGSVMFKVGGTVRLRRLVFPATLCFAMPGPNLNFLPSLLLLSLKEALQTNQVF